LQQWKRIVIITIITITIIITIIPNYIFLKIVLTPQFTLQKFKVVNPAVIPDFLLERASSHDNENNITILVNLLERVS